MQVFLFGPLPDLLELNPNDISATIDLEGKDAGTHKVKVEVRRRKDWKCALSLRKR